MELNNISSKRNDSDRTNLDLSPLAIAAINLGDDIDGWEEHCCLRNTILEDEDIIWNGTDISDSVDEFSEEGQYNEDSLKYLYQMPSIFDGLNSATDDDIRFLIAQFENITTDNIINIYGKNATNAIITGVNRLAGVFVKKEILNKKDSKSLEQIIENDLSILKQFPRKKLDALLQKRLSDRVNGDNLTFEQLSFTIIDKVADYFNIDKDLTLADTVEALYQIYIERLISQYRKKLENSTEREREENASNIECEISKLSSKDKEGLCKALNVKELSGKTIQKMLLTAEDTSLLLSAASSMECPIFLTKIMKSIIKTALSVLAPAGEYIGVTTILSNLSGSVGLALLAGVGAWQLIDGKNKIDSELLGQVVYSSRSLYGKTFLPVDEVLPSWIAPDNQEENAEFVNNQEKIAFLKKKLMQAQKEFDIKFSELSEAKKQKNSYKNELDRIIQKANEAAKEIVSLNNDQTTRASKVVTVRKRLENALKQERELQQEHEKLKIEIDIEETGGSKNKENLKDLFVQKDTTLKQLQNVIQQLQKDFASNKHALKKGYEDINYHKNFIRKAEEREVSLKEMIDRQTKSIDVLQNEIEKRSEKKDICKVDYDRESAIFVKKLNTKWSDFFNSTNRHFEYEDSFLKAVVALEYSLRLDVEKKMLEIFCAKNPTAITRQRDRYNNIKNQHSYVRVRKVYKLEYYSPNVNLVRFIDFVTNE